MTPAFERMLRPISRPIDRADFEPERPIGELTRQVRNLADINGRQQDRQNGQQIIIEQMNVRNDEDIERIAQRLFRLQQTRMRGGRA